MRREVILTLLGRIYPAAASYTAQALDGGTVRAWQAFEEPGNQGIFVFFEQREFSVGYLAFECDLPNQNIAKNIQAALLPYLAQGGKEIYLNVYGRNPQAMRMVQEMGFHLEMHGVKLERRELFPASTLAYSSPSGMPLCEKAFEEVDFHALAGLFDRAYAPLRQGEGLRIDMWQRDPRAFREYCARFDAQGGFWAYAIEEYLVGALLQRGSYISDLAVDPVWQDKGIGHTILARTTNRILKSGTGYPNLDVAMSNTPAMRFYQRLDFSETGCFADHLYQGN